MIDRWGDSTGLATHNATAVQCSSCCQAGQRPVCSFREAVLKCTASACHKDEAWQHTVPWQLLPNLLAQYSSSDQQPGHAFATVKQAGHSRVSQSDSTAACVLERLHGCRYLNHPLEFTQKLTSKLAAHQESHLRFRVRTCLRSKGSWSNSGSWSGLVCCIVPVSWCAAQCNTLPVNVSPHPQLPKLGS